MHHAHTKCGWTTNAMPRAEAVCRQGIAVCTTEIGLTAAPRHFASLAHRATTILAHRATILTRRLAASAPERIVGALLLVGIGACGFSDPAAARRGTVVVDTLESGTILVRNSPPADRYATPRWILEEELRIGILEGAGPALFGQIKGIEVDDEGRIYVLESQAQEIRVFGADGAHLFTFGRKGEGPGELLGAHGIARAPDGRIWVPDHTNGRYTVFEGDGTLAATHRTFFWSHGYYWCCGFGRDGYLYDDAGRDQNSTEHRPLLRRFNGQAEIVAEFSRPAPPAGLAPDFYSFESPDGRSGGTMAIPFGSSHQATFDPRGGFLTVMTDRYRITQLGLEGDTVRIVEASLEPIAVSAAERTEAEESVRSFASRFGATPDLSRIPTVKPLIISTFVDDDDNLWVRTPASGEEAHFDIFDAEGRFLGAAHTTFAIPERWKPLVRRGYLYAVVQGEMDEPYVVRARAMGAPLEGVR